METVLIITWVIMALAVIFDNEKMSDAKSRQYKNELKTGTERHHFMQIK